MYFLFYRIRRFFGINYKNLTQIEYFEETESLCKQIHQLYNIFYEKFDDKTRSKIRKTLIKLMRLQKKNKAYFKAELKAIEKLNTEEQQEKSFLVHIDNIDNRIRRLEIITPIDVALREFAKNNPYPK